MDVVECNILDTVRHVLKALCLGLPAHVHHPVDCVDGGGEGVELLREPCDRQIDLSCSLDQLTGDCRV
jgi:hypothetical protein